MLLVLLHVACLCRRQTKRQLGFRTELQYAVHIIHCANVEYVVCLYSISNIAISSFPPFCSISSGGHTSPDVLGLFILFLPPSTPSLLPLPLLETVSRLADVSGVCDRVHSASGLAVRPHVFTATVNK